MQISYDSHVDLLNSINREVNRFRYETDLKVHGKIDYWTAHIEKYNRGDCDDYTLSKRDRLLNLGIDYRALFPTVCRVDGEGHLVLVVRTDKGDFVLDNMRDEILPVSALNYEWLFRLDPESGKWLTLKPK